MVKLERKDINMNSLYLGLKQHIDTVNHDGHTDDCMCEFYWEHFWKAVFPLMSERMNKLSDVLDYSYLFVWKKRNE